MLTMIIKVSLNMKQIKFTTQDVLNMTGLKQYQLEYFVQQNKVPVERYGKSKPRIYNQESVNTIIEIMASRGQRPYSTI